MIVEGTEPENVIISGSVEYNDVWKKKVNIYSHNWKYDWGFKSAWGDRLGEMAQRQELVFINNERLKQVKNRNLLESGTFCIDTDDNGELKLFVYPESDINFADATIEVSEGPDKVNQWIWGEFNNFHIQNKNNFVLRNLVIKHGNNRAGRAAVEIGQHQQEEFNENILVENCIFIDNNGSGLIIQKSQNVTLRKNEFIGNGFSGIDTGNLKNWVFEGNVTSHNNWRGALGDFHGWAVGGIKYHKTVNGILRNHTAKNNLSPGIWFDIWCENILVDNIVSNNNYSVGFLPELSRDIYVKDSTFNNNTSGVRPHSAHNITLDNVTVKGNAVAFITYDDHRQFDHFSTEPTDWEIINSHIEAVNKSEWLQQREKRIPGWMNYKSRGYSQFFHFSTRAVMDEFISTLKVVNNTWIHYTEDDVFPHPDGDYVNYEEWKKALTTER